MDNHLIHELRRLKSELKNKYGVVKIGYFDCYIDHHHNRLCDLNVLVELEKPLGWKLFALKEFLEAKLEVHIDILTPRAIRPALKDEIMASVKFA